MPEKFYSQKNTKIYIKDSIGQLMIPLETIYFLRDINNSVSIMLSFLTNENQFVVDIDGKTDYFNCNIEHVYEYQGKGKPTEFIAEENADRDYYTKIETNQLLDKKQDKLTAGDNITIKDNVISATGGGVDSNNYYTKPEVDKKLEDVKSQFPITF
ncbi:hypothetical protein SHM_23260 [Spiroplasma ixodetis]|uniref:Uncharacterized protein n=1 Tax=Spiroplasma ixodetis TaxID=2141 RepID=A0ABM8BXS7_9MOLU|nr:hypothetical protein SHM_23260 [Spiroplasma ixodetis]